MPPKVRRLGLILVAIPFMIGIFAEALFLKSSLAECPLTFADEFNGANLDTSRWQTTFKSGDLESQTYVPGALQVSGGLLHITAQPQAGQGRPYTSGIVTTQGSFAQQYGYFEVRARVPRGNGLWPAIWLLHTGPLPWTEIDVMEVLGDDTIVLNMSNHWRDAAGGHHYMTLQFSGPDFSEDFHTVGVYWTADRLTWYVDGTQRAQTSEHVPAEPMYLLANLAVGGAWPGYPDASTPFPAQLDIDYIRIYAPGCRPGLFGLIGAWPGG